MHGKNGDQTMFFIITFHWESEPTGTVLRVHTDNANHTAMNPIHDRINEHVT